MYLNEALIRTNTEYTIEEGIRFFKNSNKMRKLASVILQKSQFIEEDDKRKEIIILTNKINKLADKFDNIEQAFKTRKITGKNPVELRQKYKDLEIEYAEIVDMANKERIKNILKNINSYAILVASMILPTLLISKLAKNFGSMNPVLHQKTLNPFVRAGIYLGGAGLVRSVSPTRRIENINKDVVNRSSTALQNREIL